MYRDLFKDFLLSEDTLRVYNACTLLFASNKDRLLPLLEYCRCFSPQTVTIFDRIMGNAAALLAVKAGCREVYSPLGSELAIATLTEYGIGHYITRIVPFIRRADGQGMCPMEKLSIDQNPEEFYRTLTQLFCETARHESG